MDNPIVKEFDTGIPYIPGSSLKGKVRFLLEKKYNNGAKREKIEELFGIPAENNKEKKLTIILIRDAYVEESFRKKLEEKIDMGEPITEEKNEVVLRSGAVPRKLERAPKGYEFVVEVVFRFYEVDDEAKRKEYIELFEEGLRLLEEDYLGGSGSRGYGKIKIEKINDE